MKLTDTKIKGLKPQAKLYRVADGKGLSLEITPAGNKLWRYRFRLHGKANMLALGASLGGSQEETGRSRGAGSPWHQSRPPSQDPSG
jgi:hypothetical protein